MKSSGRHLCIATFLVVIIMSGITQAATITMTASNVSWLNAMWGSPGAEPTTGNDYVLAYVGTTNPGLVRVSPKGSSGNGNTIFPGDSITVPALCRFLMKQYGGEYATIKDDGTHSGTGLGSLIMNEGSRMSNGANNGNPGAALMTSLNLGQLIINGSNVLYDNNNGQAGCNINGVLTGAGNLNMAKESGNYGRFLAVFKSVGNFTGTLTANLYIDLALGSDTVFLGGVTLAGTGPNNGTLKVNKNLQFIESKLIANGTAVPTGVYSGAGLTALNTSLGAVYFTDEGGTLTVGQVTKAYFPQPANQSVNIPVALNQLYWTNPPTDGTITCNVYLGTNPSSLPIIGSGLTGTCTAIPYTLSANTTYYWRVDCHDSIKGLLAGDTWSFQTEIPSVTLDNYSSHTGNGTLGYTFTTTSGQKLRIAPSSNYIVRISAIQNGETFLPDDHYEMVADHAMGGSLTLVENADSFTLQTAASDGIEIRISKSPLRLSFFNKDTQTLLVTDNKGISWKGTRTDVDFTVSDDHFFGAGHPGYAQLNSLDLRGNEVQRNYGAGQGPLIVPFFMSHKGYGIFMNSMFPNRFRFVYNNEYSFGFDDQGYGGRMDYYFIIGPQIAQMLDRYTQLTGRPRLPQKSMFGLQLSDKGADYIANEPWWKNAITQHRAAGFPLDHIVNDNQWRAGSGGWSGSWFEWAITEGRYPDPAEWATWTKNQGLTMTLDLNRNICDESWGWSSTFNIPNSGCSGSAAPDYSSQAVRDWNWELFWEKSLNPSLNYPGDALWMDEPDDMGCISDSVIMADGRRWAENKNYYFFLLAKAVVQEGWDNENSNSPAGIGEVKRPFVWARGMTAGAQRYALHWTGDVTCTFPVMQQHVRAMQASGLSGFPYFNHDAGGFHAPGPDDNVYRQWEMAMGSFSPIWRPHGPGDNDRWPLLRSAACQADAMVYSKLRYELMPYTYTLAYQAHATGMPMAKAMVIDYQNEPLAWSSDMQYMWGSQMLVAPNCSAGNNNVTVWLPAGSDWYDFWTHTVYPGGRTLAYYAPTGVQPMFVKKGSVIPRAPYALSTFWIPKETLILDVYTGSDGSFDLYEDDGVSEYFRTQNQYSITPIQYQDGCKVLTIGAANGQYSGKPQGRSYKIRYYGVNQNLPMGVNGVRLPEFATEQEVINNGYGYVYLPAEHKIIALLQSTSMDADTLVGPVGANPDINNDGIIDIEDLADIAAGWLNFNCSIDNCWCNKTDINGDSFIDFRDFAELAGQWFLVNNDWEQALKNDLNAMADTLTATLQPWSVPAAVFPVENYGAVANGATVNTTAIQNAIDACSAAGGGVVRFSSGDYVTGTIRLKSGVMLEVTQGARILGSTSLADYPEIIEEFKSVMSENHQFRLSLIYAEKADRVGIRGDGEIYFRGEKANFPGSQTTGAIPGRPFGIRMIQCSRVVVKDIFLRNAAAWMQSYIYCNDLIFDNMKVENHANYNNDGLDIDGCTNVIVRNCIINSEDDAMCLKGCSGLPTQNILIENSTFVTTCNALKIGTDTQGPFHTVLARNLTLGGIPLSMPSSAGRQASTGVTLATVDGGNVENILVTNIVINQARCPVFIRVGNRGRVMPGVPKPLPGTLQKILIENVTGENNYRQGSFISGITGHKINDVIIRNYNVSMEGGGMAGAAVAENEGGYPDAHQFSVNGLPSYGFYVRHADDILLDAVNIIPVNPDARPAFASGGDVANVIINGNSL